MSQGLENLSAAEIELFQEQKLLEMLLYLQQKSPYYQRLFSESNISVNTINSLRDLQKIPTTTKEDFAKNNFDFLCVPCQKIIDYTTTSGTTGTPVTVALTENDLQRLAYNEEQSFLTAGCKSSDVFQLLLTLDRQFMAGMAYYLGIRKMGASAIRSGAVSPQAQWENIFRFKPNVLVAVPSFVLKMLDYAEAGKINFATSSVQKIICIGEPIRNADLTPNILAKRINGKWNVALHSTYASTEMQTAFTECEHANGNHLRPELLIVELLNDAGEQVKSGEAGEVTITTIGVEGMPLLRYRTGDICISNSEKCKCGRNTIRLSPVIGRKNQMLKYKGTTIFPTAIYDALSHVEEVKDYVVEISKNKIGMDEILIHLSISGSTDVVEPKLKSALQTKLRAIPCINFVSSQYLQSLRPSESRQPVLIIFR